MSSRTSTIAFAGHAWLLDARAALFWPKYRTLIVSDLHLEKGTFLAQHGFMIAPYDTHDTLERLAELMAHYQPERVILLGDSFHDRSAFHRLGNVLRERLQQLAEQVTYWHWIEGNHDRSLMTANDSIIFEGELALDGVLFTHDHLRGAALPQIIGHYHPKTRVTLNQRTARGKCFAHTERLLIMPAFGTYTGGLDMGHAQFRELSPTAPFTRHLLYRNNIYRLATGGE